MLKEIKTRAIIAPHPVLIVATYDEDKNPDAMNVAWGGQCWDNKIAINISSNHKTTENIRKTRAMTVHIADEERVELADYLGIVSGHDKTKLSHVHATVVPAEKVMAPIIEEFILAMECKVVSITDIGDGGTRIVAEVVRTVVDDTILDENGKVDYSKLKPITFDSESNTYRTLGPVVAKAFSVGKKLK